MDALVDNGRDESAEEGCSVLNMVKALAALNWIVYFRGHETAAAAAAPPLSSSFTEDAFN